MNIEWQKSVTFDRHTEAMGFGIFVAMLEQYNIMYNIVEQKDHWTVTIYGHKI